jgi:hypothetical protein
MAIDVKTILQSYLDGPQGATGPQGNQGATGLLSSAIYEPLNLYPSGSVSGSANSIRFYESTPNGTNYVGFKGADNISGNVTWTLPSGDGIVNQVLTTNASGVLSWSHKDKGVSINSIQYSGGYVSGVYYSDASRKAMTWNASGLLTKTQHIYTSPSVTFIKDFTYSSGLLISVQESIL